MCRRELLPLLILALLMLPLDVLAQPPRPILTAEYLSQDGIFRLTYPRRWLMTAAAGTLPDESETPAPVDAFTLTSPPGQPYAAITFLGPSWIETTPTLDLTSAESLAESLEIAALTQIETWDEVPLSDGSAVLRVDLDYAPTFSPQPARYSYFLIRQVETHWFVLAASGDDKDTLDPTAYNLMQSIEILPYPFAPHADISAIENIGTLNATEGWSGIVDALAERDLIHPNGELIFEDPLLMYPISSGMQVFDASDTSYVNMVMGAQVTFRLRSPAENLQCGLLVRAYVVRDQLREGLFVGVDSDEQFVTVDFRNEADHDVTWPHDLSYSFRQMRYLLVILNGDRATLFIDGDPVLEMPYAPPSEALTTLRSVAGSIVENGCMIMDYWVYGFE